MDITILPQEDGAEKQRLHEAIKRKQDEIETVVKKSEDLRWSLLEIKKIYMERIGRVYLEIDQIDSEITMYHEIEKIMKQGHSFSEAKHLLKAELEKQEEKINEDRQKLEEEVTIIANRQNIAKPDLTKIKQLFRTLIMKFHPDLTQDTQEKTHREQMMKQINKAYEENDLEWLTRISEEEMVRDYQSSSIDFLKKKLEEYFHLLEAMKKEYKDLLSSEWNSWKKKIVKAKKEKRDAFAELRKNLLETLATKNAILADLKATYET